jgi:hypothetical protein
MRAKLYVEAAPYALLERRRREPLPEQSWQELLAWLRGKALGLVRLARLEPRVVGACCPFCPFVLPAGELLNRLLDHVAATHPDLRLQGLTLGDTPLLTTDRGDFPSGRQSASSERGGGGGKRRILAGLTHQG